MNVHFYKGLKFKMTLVFSVIFISFSVLFSGYTYRYFRQSFVDNYNKYLFSRAKILINRTEINPDIIALPDTGESIRVFYHDDHRQEKIVFQSPGSIRQIRIPYRHGVADTLGQHGVYLKKDNDDGRPVEILLTVSNLELQQKLKHLAYLMLVSTLAMAVISAFTIYFAAGWLLNPVRQIIRTATQINTDKLGTRLVAGQTHDELQQLAETINAMLDRIEQEQALQNNFFAAASHELRTPLAILRAETELHLSHQHLPATKSLLQSQLAEIDRLQHIVQQFLLISQLKHKGLKLILCDVDISEQLLKVFARNNLLLKNSNLRTSIVFDEEVASYLIRGDYDKLEIIWQNLVQNAVKYAVPGSVVKCAVSQQNGHLIISFENEIAEVQIPTEQLGTAFYQPETVNAGSGLGLWLCKQLISMHNGSITFYSRNHTFKVLVTLILPRQIP